MLIICVFLVNKILVYLVKVYISYRKQDRPLPPRAFFPPLGINKENNFPLKELSTQERKKLFPFTLRCGGWGLIGALSGGGRTSNTR